MKLVECVPNFSEGRDKAKMQAIVDAAKSAGVAILDWEMDSDHHRSVLSFVGAPEACVEACFLAAKKAVESIDLNVHKGEHPRIGAVDVIPFIPIMGLTMEDCTRLAETLGERIGRELNVPVFLYDRAAKRPERRDLADVRKGQFEGLKHSIGHDESRRPDYGPDKIHPTAGAVAVGARELIVNLNFNLDAHDMAAGKEIAKRLRASSGGLPAVRAKEINLAARGQTQISTVLTDYNKTSINKLFFEMSRLTAEKGAKIKTTEIVGLLPRQALIDFALEVLKLEDFDPAVQILENRLEAVGATAAVDWRQAGRIVGSALSNVDSTPGGGSAAAIAGAMGCGLGEMALGITLKSKKLAPDKRPPLEAALKALGEMRETFDALASDDAEAFERFMTTKSQEALKRAAEVPLKIAQIAAGALAVARTAAPLAGKGVVSDVNCALHLLKAAALSAAENVRINLGGIKDENAAKDLARRLEKALAACA